jgi:aryl-alcohol dehydrogenase-like predicted oxidoreductase
MRLPGVRGTAEDTALACDLLQEAVGLGASVIDTADFYGGGLANRLIAKALAPYPDRLIISTKVGVKANADGRPAPAATPQEIRDTVERDLGNLGLSALDLVFLRLPGGPLGDSGVPMERSLECLAELQSDGIVRHIGLSSATAKQIEAASAIVSVDAVQNALFIGGGQSTEVVQLCTDRKIPFFAYFPLGMGTLIEKKVDLTPLATTYRASTSQVALAWLLSLSPVVVPIPGTSNPEHLRENMASERIVLSNDDARRLSDVA